MGRPKRAADGGLIYHVLNRANARLPIFEKEGDYEAFERVLREAVERMGTRLLAFCLMPNHWHLVVLPIEDGELSRFTGWLTLTHTQRWHAHRHSTGESSEKSPGLEMVQPMALGAWYCKGEGDSLILAGSSKSELASVCVKRGCPLGQEDWTLKIAARLESIAGESVYEVSQCAKHLLRRRLFGKIRFQREKAE
jgi:REP element-mobilizing transposase RayT